MGTRSLQSDSNPRRKRSFTLSSFRKPAGDQQAVATNAVSAAEDIARMRKAAAWQWYTRGVGEVVVPTKRPIPGGTPLAGAGGGLTQSKGAVEESSIEKKCSATKHRLPAADRRRAASRFKAEASARVSRPIPAGPSPLYDEFELSSLKTQMVDFVQRLQKKESEQRAANPLNFDPAPAAPADNHSSTQHLHPPAEGSGVCKSKSASVEGSGFHRPMSVLQKLFRKVMAIPFSKNNSAAIQEPEALPDEPEPDDVQYHYHHYIHHHHHHHHYGGPSPEEAEFTRRRRHSESSGIRSRIPSSIWEENEVTTEGEEEEEENSLSAFISRRRRHSDSVFAEHNEKLKTNYEGAEWPDKEPVKPAELQLLRRYNSERFTTRNKEENVGKDVKIGEEQLQGADIKSRRRHSTRSFREGEAENLRWRMGAATEEAKARGGGAGDGGGVYKLGGERVYECTRRRHSESLYGGGYDIEEKEGVRGWRSTLSSASTRRGQGPRSAAQPEVGRKRQPHSASLPPVRPVSYKR